MALRQIQILHKQLRQVVLLITSKLQMSLNQDGGQTKNSKLNGKVDLLNFSLLIANWVNSFNPKNINDCFDESQNRVPDDFQAFEDKMKQELVSLKREHLSPNRKSLNDFIQG